jgi:hypothetical protein
VRSALRKVDLASAQRLARDALQLGSDVAVAALAAEHRRGK